ncbi:hypothetical protein [Thermoanaerobacter pentosaceus]|uniref:Uncharacterized protein n=1 Tax=Thermoanaerobacter pentosaceus TaxID=694059 RepID=A0ABT9M6L4_9THEO|nr:hypothetical protein [Thermoanaerobacter pentosaceus]MDP9751757.1 hypothetical protein [Thermoanaerobacter pentosaceus]
MTDKKIKDNYTFKEMEYNLQEFKILKKAYELISLFEIRNESIQKSFNGM